MSGRVGNIGRLYPLLWPNCPLPPTSRQHTGHPLSFSCPPLSFPSGADGGVEPTRGRGATPSLGWLLPPSHGPDLWLASWLLPLPTQPQRTCSLAWELYCRQHWCFPVRELSVLLVLFVMSRATSAPCSAPSAADLGELSLGATRERVPSANLLGANLADGGRPRLLSRAPPPDVDLCKESNAR
jgi:hypothetical protein